MAYTATDVENWLGLADGALDAGLLARVIDAVDAHAARHYDLADIDADSDAERDQALIMEAARVYTRKHSANGYTGTDDLGAVRVLMFDPDVRSMLSGRLITAGMFGPSANTADDA